MPALPTPSPAPPKPQKSVTLHDVARAAGVSLITASRALSNPAVVSDKAIARVQDAVIATGYIPNLLAGGLKSRRSMTVAALVPAISVAQFLPTVQALTESLGAAGYQLILGQSGYDHAREQARSTPSSAAGQTAWWRRVCCTPRPPVTSSSAWAFRWLKLGT